MHSVCPCSLSVWRRSFLKKWTPLTYFGPALDPPLGGSGRKITTLVRDHEYFMNTKFHQNPSSGSGEEVENVKRKRKRSDSVLWQKPLHQQKCQKFTTTDDGRRTTTDGRTDGRCAMTIAHLSRWLRWAKKTTKKKPKRGDGIWTCQRESRWFWIGWTAEGYKCKRYKCMRRHVA